MGLIDFIRKSIRKEAPEVVLGRQITLKNDEEALLASFEQKLRTILKDEQIMLSRGQGMLQFIRETQVKALELRGLLERVREEVRRSHSTTDNREFTLRQIGLTEAAVARKADELEQRIAFIERGVEELNRFHNRDTALSRDVSRLARQIRSDVKNIREEVQYL